jgi:hypothetical protein
MVEYFYNPSCTRRYRRKNDSSRMALGKNSRFYPKLTK